MSKLKLGRAVNEIITVTVSVSREIAMGGRREQVSVAIGSDGWLECPLAC